TLSPADSLALQIDVPATLDRAAQELARCQGLLKAGRWMDAQRAAEQLLADLHELRQRVPLSYVQNQQFVRLVQQAGSVRLHCVRQHLSLRPAFQPPPAASEESQPAAGGEEPEGAPAGGPTVGAAPGPGLPTDSVLASPEAQQIVPESNDRVQHWIDFFSGRGHATFQAWLSRSGEYLDMMMPVLERNGLPPDLIHVVFVESGFNPKALSRSAASGPWQFVKSTARIFGLNVNPKVDERRDPKRSTEAAAQYLKHLYSLFHDWPLALAAYNSGEGTVLRALGRQNTFNYWSLNLPRQTRDYVPAFMAALTIAKDPAAYGFQGQAINPPLSFDEIPAPGGVNLKVLAYLTRSPIELLRRLNPAILRKQASPRDGGTMVRVPKGTGPEVLARLQARDYPAALARPEVETTRHRVKKGETLRTIARHYGLTASALARANHIRDPGSRLRRGAVLSVPLREAAGAEPAAWTPAVPAGPPTPPAVRRGMLGPPTPPQLAEVETEPAAGGALGPASATRATPAVAEAAMAPALDLAAGPRPAELVPIHLVRKGETLYGIAALHHCKAADLVRWNGLRPGAPIHPGMTLRVAAGD
ncbi:MAG TPA: transglycosylase SLT domain-containing protein, partial [Candidatus Saccharimonadales bacterium]|nr:transglycosylase SLT domain-containing protein [Candidatus Saccharimonadales bacterium]